MQLLCVVCTFKATCQLFTALSYQLAIVGGFMIREAWLAFFLLPIALLYFVKIIQRYLTKVPLPMRYLEKEEEISLKWGFSDVLNNVETHFLPDIRVSLWWKWHRKGGLNVSISFSSISHIYHTQCHQHFRISSHFQNS